MDSITTAASVVAAGLAVGLGAIGPEGSIKNITDGYYAVSNLGAIATGVIYQSDVHNLAIGHSYPPAPAATLDISGDLRVRSVLDDGRSNSLTTSTGHLTIDPVSGVVNYMVPRIDYTTITGDGVSVDFSLGGTAKCRGPEFLILWDTANNNMLAPTGYSIVSEGSTIRFSSAPSAVEIDVRHIII